MKFTKSITVLGMDTTELMAALASGELKPRANTETENGNENDPAPTNLRLGSGGKDSKAELRVQTSPETRENRAAPARSSARRRGS